MEKKDVVKITNSMFEELTQAAYHHKEGLTCPREALNSALDIVGRAMSDAQTAICSQEWKACLQEKFKCDNKPRKEVPTAYGYNFHLSFDCPKNNDFFKVKDEEISRILCAMVGEMGSLVVAEDIDNSIFHEEHSPNEVIRVMLKMLLFSGETMVAFCFDDAKYILSRNHEDTVCAYDHQGIDQHRIFRITILEKDEREFFGIWGDGYTTSDKKVLTGELTWEAISLERGYNQVDIQQLDALKPGESWTANTPEFHVIVRTK